MMEEATGVNQVQWCHLTMVIMEDQAVDLGQAIMDLEEVRPFPETDPAQEQELVTVVLSTLENNISSVRSIYICMLIIFNSVPIGSILVCGGC